MSNVASSVPCEFGVLKLWGVGGRGWALIVGGCIFWADRSCPEVIFSPGVTVMQSPSTICNITECEPYAPFHTSPHKLKSVEVEVETPSVDWDWLNWVYSIQGILPGDGDGSCCKCRDGLPTSCTWDKTDKTCWKLSFEIFCQASWRKGLLQDTRR